jgi:hypothetical protein
VSESVRDVQEQLLAAARERREVFDSVLLRFAFERLVYRMCQSPYRDQFVVKGALLLPLWLVRARPTRDLDLHAVEERDGAALGAVFQEIAAIDGQDALDFPSDAIRAERIQDRLERPGLRLFMEARLGAASVPLQVDVTTGDVIRPGPVEAQLQLLLGQPPARPFVYPKEVFMGEKLQSLVVQGIPNAQMKNVFDIYELARNQHFDGNPTVNGIAPAFHRRKTELIWIEEDAIPLVFDDTFSLDPVKTLEWKAYLKLHNFPKPLPTLKSAMILISKFFMSLVHPMVINEPFPKHWSPGGPWK